MKAIFTMYVELWRAIGFAFHAPQVLALLAASAMIAASGALVMMRLEGWSYLDALYFCVVTMATVGYGDLAPKTPMGRIFVIGFLLIGIGVFVLTVSALAESAISNFRARNQKEGTDPSVNPPPPE